MNDSIPKAFELSDGKRFSVLAKLLHVARLLVFSIRRSMFGVQRSAFASDCAVTLWS
ncbi:MAG TPA: hypothetical protein VGM62_01260 [Chthoniobacterales bacterium]